jgi:heme-degrading monooxygenase HmoA
MNTTNAADREALTVIFEFDVEVEEQQPLCEGIERLIREVVSRQPGFVAGNLHVSRDGRKVLNYLQWESLEAFERFRDNEDKQRQIRSVVGPYGPKPRVYDVVTVPAKQSQEMGMERRWTNG